MKSQFGTKATAAALSIFFSLIQWCVIVYIFFFELFCHLFRVSSLRLFIHSVQLGNRFKKKERNMRLHKYGSKVKREKIKKKRSETIYLFNNIVKSYYVKIYHLYPNPAYSYIRINLASFIARRMARSGNISPHIILPTCFSLKMDTVNNNYSNLIFLLFRFRLGCFHFERQIR